MIVIICVMNFECKMWVLSAWIVSTYWGWTECLERVIWACGGGRAFCYGFTFFVIARKGVKIRMKHKETKNSLKSQLLF